MHMFGEIELGVGKF